MRRMNVYSSATLGVDSLVIESESQTMKRVISVLVSGCLFVAGCSSSSAPATKAPTGGPAASTSGNTSPGADAPSAGPGTAAVAPAAGSSSTTATTSTEEATATPVPIESGIVALTPENSKILFVGTHVGPKPDPRTGGFEKFQGKLDVDTSAKAIKSVAIEIETNSLWTQIGQLTNHLKSPDFLEVRQFPTLSFTSSEVTAGAGEGEFDVNGKLNLHGVEKEIRIPVKVQISDAGVTLRSHFRIDRTEYGIVFGPDRVEKEVALTVIVGEKTQPLPPQGPPGGGRGGAGN